MDRGFEAGSFVMGGWDCGVTMKWVGQHLLSAFCTLSAASHHWDTVTGWWLFLFHSHLTSLHGGTCTSRKSPLKWSPLCSWWCTSLLLSPHAINSVFTGQFNQQTITIVYIMTNRTCPPIASPGHGKKVSKLLLGSQLDALLLILSSISKWFTDIKVYS